MATLSQRIQKFNNRLYYRPKHPALRGSPQRKGIVIRLRICTPRKPNSARRPVVKVFLSTKRRTISHIPGSGHTLRRHSKVLISGQGPRDLPGVNYSCIRGKYDFEPMHGKRFRRSIYGVKMPVEFKGHVRRKLREIIKEGEERKIYATFFS